VSTGWFLFVYGEQRMKHSELVFGYGSASFIDAESALIFFVGGCFCSWNQLGRMDSMETMRLFI
jgi:hypothetical protein